MRAWHRPFAAPSVPASPLALAFLAAAAVAAVPPAGGARAGDAGEEIIFVQRGEASWYGKELAGKRTASGREFDPGELVAAHRKLPLGSEVTVTRVETGDEVRVEIVDRGPHAKGRIIDVSRAAAEELGIVDAGAAAVRVTATADQLAEAGGGEAAAAAAESR